ncbi:MAG: NADH-quinone oxidoreductase subunit NuoI [bacterium]
MFREFAKGFAVTFKHMLERPITVNYPEERRAQAVKFRGRHILHRYADGLEKCVGCHLCAIACPTEAIYLEAQENDSAHPHSPGERYAEMYSIHLLRCIFCGFCEEACPYDAITMGPEFELANYSRQNFILDKKQMLQTPELGHGDWRGYTEYQEYATFREKLLKETKTKSS